MVAVYYGSTHDFRFPQKTVQQVAEKLRMPWTTVQRILQKFRAGNFVLETLVAKKPRSFSCIPERVQRILLSRDILQTWAPYSIKERTHLIKTQLHCNVSSDTVWQFYLSRGVSFRTGIAVYR